MARSSATSRPRRSAVCRKCWKPSSPPSSARRPHGHHRPIRSPTDCRCRPARPARRCSGPCGSSCRSGGWAAGRRRRTRAASAGAGAILLRRGWSPARPRGPASGGTARTTRRWPRPGGRRRASARGRTASPRCGPGAGHRRRGRAAHGQSALRPGHRARRPGGRGPSGESMRRPRPRRAARDGQRRRGAAAPRRARSRRPARPAPFDSADRTSWRPRLATLRSCIDATGCGAAGRALHRS